MFIENPKNMTQGLKQIFSRLKNKKDIDNITNCLREFSNNEAFIQLRITTSVNL